MNELTARFQVSVSTIQNNKQRLAVTLREFFGVGDRPGKLFVQWR